MVGAIVSGAIFGDNLAPISDTTIASALTQDAEVRDVVRTRLPYSLIAGVISAVLFIIVGIKTSTSVTLPDVIDPAYAKTLVMLVIPVIMIILMLRGWNLISTLIVCDLVGFVLCLVFGFLDVPTLFSATGPIGAGLTGMLNVICFSFFMFALLEMLKRSGVFDMLLEKLNNASKTPRQAELVTILLSVIGSVAIGAASISILFVGPVVRKLLQTHNIERTRGSNLMDGIATGLAGIVPYNPVGLNAVSLAIASGVVSESFSFLDCVPYNFHSWLLILLFLMPYASMIPMTCLAAILIMVAYNMSGFKTFGHMIKTAPKSDILVLITTLLLTVFFDLVVAIEIGMVMAAFLFMKRMSDVGEVKPWIYKEDLDKNEISEHTDLKNVPRNTMVYEILGPIFFAETNDYLAFTHEKHKNVLILRMRDVPAMDITGLESLEEAYKTCQKKGIHLLLSHVNEQPRHVMEKAGFVEKLGEENFCENIDVALKKAATFDN